MALMQHDQARQQFNSGLAGLSAALYPGRTSAAWMKTMTGGGEDAGSTMSDLVKIQQIRAAEPGAPGFPAFDSRLRTKTGMTEDEVRAISPQAWARS